jgi:hypothetical protein
VDANGIPISWNTDAGNRNDYAMFFPLLDQIKDQHLIDHIGTLHTDRGFNYPSTRQHLATDYNITNFVAPERKRPKTGAVSLVGMGKRWIVEAANSWLRNYGQLRRNTDRTAHHRNAAPNFAITLFIVHRLQAPNSPIR